MDNKIKEFIKNAISNLIDNTSSDKKVKHLIKKHIVKTHFIPIRYRIFGGLLQSMNIQFGNFVEKLLHEIVKNESSLSVNKNSSKKIELPITQKSNDLIDKYITECQENVSNDLQKDFTNLLDECINIEKTTPLKAINSKHDIDVLFSSDNSIYYLEVKYNDDHDTGKYADINRKFIKSYIGICNLIKVYDLNKFKPILYYMTQKRMKGNIYIPEHTNIYRGDRLFKEFFTIDYKYLDKVMQNIGDDDEIVKLFDDLYIKIRQDIEIK
jgi:hypothetical protein